MATTKPNLNYQLFCGVDISARTFTATSCRRDESPTKALSYKQTPEDFEAITKHWLSSGCNPDQILVVMEATGNYWVALATYLDAQGFAVSVVNPKQAHNFAGALGLRSKNDFLDAQTLARLAAALQPTRWTPPPVIYRELYQRLTHRAGLLEARKQFCNQLHALSVGQPVEAVVESLNKLIETLDQAIAQVEKDIRTLVKKDDEWAASIRLVQTIPGIGLLTACWLVVVSLNFSACSSAEGFSNYAGLAPVERRSGTSVRPRPTIGHGGHNALRALLYMAAGSAMRFNPKIKAYSDHLRNEKGKAYKVARCAAARKLLHIAFAVVHNQTEFNPVYKSGANLKTPAAKAI